MFPNVWATGFQLDHDDGQAVHRRGVTEVPGLYFLGLPWQHTRGSALLGWVNDDAQYLAETIGTLAQTGPPVRAR